MSTQHPDNVSVPFFASSSILAGEDEIREAYYAFSHLGCDEQMWDVEGKEIDTHIVKKLLTYYPDYFREHILGEDVRLTLRVPNPTVEKAEAKILLETLESIPRSYDAARLFYERDAPPIFEVILPMTTSARCLNRIYLYYTEHIIARQHRRFNDNDITIAQWIGEFAPPRIHVIPLFEDVPTMLNAAGIVAEYLAGKHVASQRVFLARSDTAMNSGFVSAALANKIALMRLEELSARCGVQIHPILGMGAAPFRGGLAPDTCQLLAREFPSVVTFTIQSAFKFDYSPDQVRAACDFLRTHAIGAALPLDVERAIAIIERYSAAYRAHIVALAPHINLMAKFVPPRRARKLHIGLFGYARGAGDVTLPRAITFTCALYSLGLPPELIAFDALTDSDIAFLTEVSPSFKTTILAALRFADVDAPLFPPSLRAALDKAGWGCAHDCEHLAIVRRIRAELERGTSSQISDLVLRAAFLRKFLG